MQLEASLGQFSVTTWGEEQVTGVAGHAREGGGPAHTLNRSFQRGEGIQRHPTVWVGVLVKNHEVSGHDAGSLTSTAT